MYRTLSRGASVAQFILNYVRVHLVSDIRDADSGLQSAVSQAPNLFQRIGVEGRVVWDPGKG